MNNKQFLISDQKIALFGEQVAVTEFIDTTSLKPHQIPEFEKDRLKDCKAILINAEAKVNGSNRSDLKGIELIFWLRLKYKYTGPIITYGFLSSAQILRLYPQYIVIHAPGNMHWRLGDELRIHEMQNLIGNPSDYSAYLHPFIDISAIRHRSANYYSLNRLKKFHYAVAAESITISAPVENTQELVYNNLFEDTLQSALTKDAESSLNETLEVLKEHIRELEENLKPKGNKGARQSRPIDMYNMDKETLKEMQPNNENFGFIASRFTKNKEIVDNWETELKTKKSELSAKSVLKEKQSKKLIENQRKEQLASKIKDLRNLKGKIALVDDMSDQGWEEFYSTLLGDNFTLTSFMPEEIYKDFNPTNLAIKILSNNPDTILLDLRLFNNEDSASFPSGIKVLTELRKLNPIVPIIVCSASNKGTIINLIHSKGANYYWLKEGLDLGNSVEEGIKNYEGLLDLLQLVLAVNQITVQQQYRHFISCVNEIDTFWWEEKDWKFEHTIKGEVELAFQTVIEKTTKVDTPGDIVNTVQSVLLRFSNLLFERQNKDRSNDWKENSEVVLRLGRLIEHIHRFDIVDASYDKIRANIAQYDYYYQHMRANSNILVDGVQKKGKSILLGRNDKKGSKLYKKRNKAAHFASANQFDDKTTLNYIKDFIDYLFEDNSASNDKTIYENDKKYYWDIDCNNPVF